MAEWVTAEKVLALADRLPPLEKLRLIEWLLSRLERELQATYSRPTRLARRGVAGAESYRRRNR